MILKDIWMDVKAVQERDPAARNALEVLLLYQGVHALIWHRVAHWFYAHHMFFIARLISQVARFFTLIEIIYNFWNLAFGDLEKGTNGLLWSGNFFHLQDVMDDILRQYNYTAYIPEDDECVLVIEDKPEVTATAEIVPETLALDIIRYNHRLLKGNINAKKSILLKLASELEPRRKELQELDKDLTSNIFFMLNNMNIRHNNQNINEPSKYKKYVAEIDNQHLEDWYDELYQMMLLALLLLDNIERQKSIDELKEKVAGK